MNDYRIYRLDQSLRVVGGGDDIAFPGDNEAWLYAQGLAERHKIVEVWKGTRCLGTMTAHGQLLVAT